MYSNQLEQTPPSKDQAATGIIDILNDTAYSLIDDLMKDNDQTILESKAKRFSDTLEKLWEKVEAGKIRVESIALLRVIRSVTCSDLSSRVKSQNLDKNRMVSDLGLFINQLKYVLRPTEIK